MTEIKVPFKAHSTKTWIYLIATFISYIILLLRFTDNINDAVYGVLTFVAVYSALMVGVLATREAESYKNSISEVK